MSAIKVTTAKQKGDRRSADERRDQILEIAIIEFATYGMHGASTETIATKAGISQPYIFRLFGTKKELFLAAVDRVYSRIRSTFEVAAAEDPVNPMMTMGHYYKQLLSQRYELMMLLQGFAAAEDHEVQTVVRAQYLEMINFVKETTHASEAEVVEFFAYGMLLMVGSALDLLDVLKLDRTKADNKLNFVPYPFK